MSESKHITMQMWTGSFDSIANPGDTVDNEIAMHFLNSLPPLVHYSHYFQVSEPYSHEIDTSKGKLAPTYPTFRKVDGVWMYLGNCFKGKDTNIVSEF